MSKVIYAFENTVLRKYSYKNNNVNFEKASELAKFIEDLKEAKEIERCEELNSIIVGMLEDLGALFERTEDFKKYYSKLDSFDSEVTSEEADHYVGCGVMDINDKIVKELKIFRICENYIDAEISYLKGRKDYGNKVKDTIGEKNIFSSKKGEIKYKVKWTKNKSEFARFVNEEYEKNSENYKSLRDAANKLFDEYEFEDNYWTKEKCYDLVRQT